ncbi:AAA family ATPase [Williamsia sp. 1135]|uniref:AAA family ATPase n=1 Tax=Williamsia sp. 1135 TaxID=1889262 RepID=UPI000A0FDBA2|nr:AAA family ATPase [Williamsia sp. 1135]ORM37134.1 recombinase RecF [Williamsia sp. 1135]
MTESGPTVEQSLTEVVWDLLDADSGLDEQSKYAVIAALESGGALREQIDGTAAPVERPSASDAEVVEPLGAYLKSITVAGFRGIGPRATLEVSPYPGITVISGRNGSGKSSFAEGLEFALTGESYRWRNKRAKMWADSWRNLHQGNPCEVRVEFAVPGAKVTTAGVDWADGADLAGSETWTQVAGAKRQPGTSSLGWSNALDIYRPLLTYDEIGGLLDQEPSKLYDALATLLGLEEIQDAEKRLADLLSERKQPRAVATNALRDLKVTLQGAGDARAVDAAKLLKKRQPDLDAVTALVSGADSPQTILVAKLRAIAEISVPDLDDVVSATTTLRQRESKALELADQALDAAEHRSTLLRQALSYRDIVDDEQCPVCGVGVLDDGWKQHTRDFLASEDQRLSDYRTAQAELKQARAAAEALLSGLAGVAPIDGVQLPSLGAYSAAVADARARPSDVALADHADQVMPMVAEASAELQAEATAAAEALEDAWAPIAAKINGWLSLEHTARSSDDVVARLDAAKKWVTANANVLRNQRMQPIADRAREIWSQLRQESNVDISSITLQGARTHRKAVLEGSVDGQPAAALTVMSQGELHALALALFIPRATAQASPFRFIVLDDPIQAMDPAKIDGFISVLRTLAENRQVIVFSHDDRLAASIRQLGVPAQLLEVTRETGSSITVKTAENPAKRYANDAFALVADEHVGDDIKRRAAPGLFRLALESAAQQVFYAKRAAAGQPHDESEVEWELHKKTNQRVALAVHGDAKADIAAWRSYRKHRFPALSISNRGSHGDIASLSKDDVGDLHKTVNDILAEL